MNKKSKLFLATGALLSFAVLATFSGAVLAKGGDENPTVITDGDGPLTVDGSVDANITNSNLDVHVLSQPSLTHMGQMPAEHVMLRTTQSAGTCNGPGGLNVTRVGADGTFTGTFTVPSGKVLIVTDIRAIVINDGSNSWGLGDIVTARVTFGTSGILRASVTVTAETESKNLLLVERQIVSGGAIGAGIEPCVSGEVVFFSSSIQTSARQATIFGYLIDE